MGKVLSAEKVFELYSVHGLPLDLIEDVAKERGIAIDREGFQRLLEAEREKSRAKSKFKKTHGAPMTDGS